MTTQLKINGLCQECVIFIPKQHKDDGETLRDIVSDTHNESKWGTGLYQTSLIYAFSEIESMLVIPFSSKLLKSLLGLRIKGGL